MSESKMTEKIRAGKILSLLGLAMKAKKLEIGTDRICDEVRRHGTVSDGTDNPSRIRGIGMVVIASDASANTRKRLNNVCAYYGIRCADVCVTSEEISRRVGKASPCAACATFDRGFANGIEKAVNGNSGII